MSKLAIKPKPTLADLQEYVRAMMVERNFRSDLEYLPKRFMLLTEEVGEFAKAARKTAGMRVAADSDQDQSVADEAADVLIVLLGLCNMLEIDLEQALRAKEEKNKQREWK